MHHNQASKRALLLIREKARTAPDQAYSVVEINKNLKGTLHYLWSIMRNEILGALDHKKTPGIRQC